MRARRPSALGEAPQHAPPSSSRPSIRNGSSSAVCRDFDPTGMFSNELSRLGAGTDLVNQSPTGPATRCAHRPLVEHPRDVHELSQIVKAAAPARSTVKVIGAGHSFTDIACTTGTQVVLDGSASIVSADVERRWSPCRRGSPSGRSTRRSTRSGSLCPTSVTSRTRRCRARCRPAPTAPEAVSARSRRSSSAMGIVTGDGSVLQCSTSESADVFAAARVGLGALGVVSTITLRCVPAFTLHTVERADAARRRARSARRARRRQRPLRDQLVPAHRMGAGQAEQSRRRRSSAEGSRRRSGSTRCSSRTWR